ncbi:MAG: helix-turn-helix domain-containing protein [Flavobacteriales bacterium]
MKQILKNIRSLRELRGYSQEYLADKLSITQSSYARFENGAKKTDFALLEKVAEVFEVDVCSIIHFHEQDGNGGGGLLATKDKDVKQLKERVKYLERLNDQLTKQLKDKEEIITLLKGQKSKA